MRRVFLQPYETMKRRQDRDQLQLDAAHVHEVVRNNPGICGKAEIAGKIGLSEKRVANVLKRINRGETGHTRIEYGSLVPKGGPYAGQEVRGYFTQDRHEHLPVMDQADEHAAKIELGVHRSRLVRFTAARGIRGAEEVVNEMLDRLGITGEALQENDLEAFLELVIEETGEDG